MVIKMKLKNKTIAVDFDGTLCEYSFPDIGKQTDHQKKLMKKLIDLRSCGYKIILYTCRGDNDEYKCLTDAIEWCKKQGLEFDAINENIPEFEKKSGYSPKPETAVWITTSISGRSKPSCVKSMF